MSSIIRSSFFLGVILISFQGMASMQGAEINLNSACDFRELTMDIIEEQDANPELINLNIKLQPSVRTQLTQITRNHMNQNLTLYINGIKISTATIRSEINSESLRVAVDKQTVQKIFTGLLNTRCLQR